MEKKHKRILRNTGVLYVRMFLAMAVGLYTSRIVLEILDVEDYGIYHVVAGFVALLGFMQGAMASATQRYFAFDIGENKGLNLRGLFNSSMQIHGVMALCIIVVAESVGYWFVSTQLTIPTERMEAALTAYHLSIAVFTVNILVVPFTAMIMANERMGLFALLSILEVLLKLVAVLILQYLMFDKLIVYGILLLIVAILNFCGYLILNRALFAEVRFECVWHGERFFNMLGFVAWSAWGNLAAALSGQGNNVLLNIFFGPTVNAGRSIAAQANGALNSFVSNIQAAINPQIFKLYASGDRGEMQNLVNKASKYNFFILLILSMPVLYYTEQLLNIWLIKVPSYAAIFLQLTIVAGLIDSLSRPLMTSAQATGKIRLYQTAIGGVLLCNLPAAYFILKKWPEPSLVIWTTVVLAVVALAVRLAILKNLTGMSVTNYLKTVVFRIMMVSITSKFLNDLLATEVLHGVLFVGNLGLCLAITMTCIWFLGLDLTEKQFLKRVIMKVYRKALI